MSTSPEVRTASFTQTRLVALNNDSVQEAERQARAQGYAAGYAAGARAAAHEGDVLREQLHAQAVAERRDRDDRLSAAVLALDAAIAAADARITPVLQESRTTLYALAFDLASTIIGVEISQTSTETPVRNGALWALERVLAEPIDAPEFTVRMHPMDVAALQAHWDKVVEQLGETAMRMHLMADYSLQSGDAIADLPHGFLDARLSSALERARTTLRECGIPAGQETTTAQEGTP